MNDHDSWLAKFTRLRIDTASNAPHKPLLLLVALDLAQQGGLAADTLPLTPQLAFRFCSYWSIVATDRFDEDAPDQKALKDYAGQRIHLPNNELIWPDPKHLAWHREKKFEGN